MNIKEIVNSRTKPLNEWVKEKYGDSKNDHFREWCNDEMMPQYTIVYLEWLESIKCTEFHKLLFEDNDFFEKIQNYMKRVGWTRGESYAPSIDALKNTVLELSYYPKWYSSIDECTICSSGGFEIHFHPKKYLKVVFQNYDGDDTMFEKTITIVDIRKLKLNRLTYEN